MYTTLLFQKRLINRFQDEFLIFGQSHGAGEMEAMSRVAQIDFVHGAEFIQRPFRGEFRVAQLMAKQG